MRSYCEKVEWDALEGHHRPDVCEVLHGEAVSLARCTCVCVCVCVSHPLFTTFSKVSLRMST